MYDARKGKTTFLSIHFCPPHVRTRRNHRWKVKPAGHFATGRRRDSKMWCYDCREGTWRR